jgi:hypothetical protein
VKTSRFLNPLSSANEMLNDRTTMVWTMAGILILGAVVRFAWVFLKGFNVIPSEAFFEAAAFGAKGGLADAYGPGTGLSAHLSPGMPLLVGTIYRWLGVGTPVAEFILSCLSLAFVYISFLALDAAFRRLGVAPIARIAAIAILALIPLNIFFEMVGFRHWEGSLAAAGIALYLARALALDAREERPGWLDLSPMAGAAGVLSLFSPQAALACYGMLGWLALRKRGWLGFAATAAAAAALLLVITLPWALRNEAVFGERVWSRSSFGISFAVRYHDGAVSPSDPGKLYQDRLKEVSPFLSPQTLADMRAAGGELGWNRLLIDRTEQWIREHPVAALKLTARHVWEFYFPPRWMWFPDTGMIAASEQVIMWIIAAIGFVGLGAKIAGRDWRYMYVAAALLLPMLPYALVQPVVRYRYPVGALLVFLAADMTWRASAALLSKWPWSEPVCARTFSQSR